MVLVKNDYESEAVTPDSANWNVKSNESKLFDKISVATTIHIKNRVGNSDTVTAYLNTAGLKPIVLEPGAFITLEGMNCNNIFLTPGAAFGVSEKIDILISN